MNSAFGIWLSFTSTRGSGLSSGAPPPHILLLPLGKHLASWCLPKYGPEGKVHPVEPVGCLPYQDSLRASMEGHWGLGTKGPLMLTHNSTWETEEGGLIGGSL